MASNWAPAWLALACMGSAPADGTVQDGKLVDELAPAVAWPGIRGLHQVRLKRGYLPAVAGGVYVGDVVCYQLERVTLCL